MVECYSYTLKINMYFVLLIFNNFILFFLSSFPYIERAKLPAENQLVHFVSTHVSQEEIHSAFSSFAEHASPCCKPNNKIEQM